MGILQARILEWVAIPFSRESSQPRDWTQVSCIAADSLPAEPPGQLKNTGVDSLFLLQGTFLTQESNRVSSIAGGFSISWAIRKAPLETYLHLKQNKTNKLVGGGAYFLPEIQISLGIMYFYLLTIATLPSQT